MSIVCSYSHDEFTSEFTIDLGSGVRGELVNTENGFDGLIISHLEDKNICATVLTVGSPSPHFTPLWGFISKDPETLEITGPIIECILCPSHHKGYVKNGAWIEEK